MTVLILRNRSGETLSLTYEEAFENDDILFIMDSEKIISDELSSELQEAVQHTRCSVMGAAECG